MADPFPTALDTESIAGHGMGHPVTRGRNGRSLGACARPLRRTHRRPIVRKRTATAGELVCSDFAVRAAIGSRGGEDRRASRPVGWMCGESASACLRALPCFPRPAVTRALMSGTLVGATAMTI